MASRRTRRTLILLAVLALLTLIYLATGASSTESSPLYQKTMKLMEDRRPGEAGPGKASSPVQKLRDAGGVGVTGGVALELGRPIARVRACDGAVLGTRVPVTAIDEDRDSLPGEKDVRRSSQRRSGIE